MAVKRKISVRKVLQALVTLIVSGGCLFAVMGASKKQDHAKLNSIKLHVRNGKQYLFLDKKALWKQLFELNGITADTTPVDRIDIGAIEREALENPWVSEAQAYIDNNKDLHLHVTQRVPLARVFFENGQSFYLDPSLKLLPLSDMFTYYTTIVTNVPVYNNDSLDNDMRGKILRLVRFIDRDSFWNAQIAQVIITPEAGFELIPVLGNHKIIFGDTVRMEEKFRHLFGFYKNVMNKIGWDKYETLDVRYKGQIVAAPSIPWKVNSKNGLSNMDWLKSIMEQHPGRDTIVGVASKPASSKPAVQKPATPQRQLAKSVVPKPTARKPPNPSMQTHAAEKPKTEKKESRKPEDKAESRPKYIYQGNR